MIALHSPYAFLKLDRACALPEKSRHSDPVLNWAVRSPQSGLSRYYREKSAYFAYFEGKWSGLSPQLRLRGGEERIRTLGTGVSPYNGLTKGSMSPPSLVVKHLQSEPMPLSRTQSLSFGNLLCSALCSGFSPMS
jgi:hypothetical protein